MTRIYHTATINIEDHEVEIELDSEDILSEIDADELVDALTNVESYKYLADRCYNCDAMLQALRTHEDANGLALDIVTDDPDGFCDYVANSKSLDDSRALLTKMWERIVYTSPPAVDPEDVPLGEKVRLVLEATGMQLTESKVRAVLQCMMLQHGVSMVTSIAVAMALENVTINVEPE